LFADNVTVEWSGQGDGAFKGSKHGRFYLTTHRLIFNNKNTNDPMISFSFPFVTLSEVEIEQPVFGANYIKGKVRAQPNGNWIGEAKFKLTFKRGGAIDFGQAMLKAAYLATRGMNNDAPPPYVPPDTQWYAAPPPAYAPPPEGYYGWAPPRNNFPDNPPTDGVYMTGAPPPYPGLNPAYQPGGPGGYPPQQGGHPPPQGGYPPPQQGGYPPPQGGYQPQGGYPPQHGGYPPPQGGYPPQGGATGFTSAADAKAAEAAQSAYYDPNRPQMAFVPPPAYYENPPSYSQATSKKDQ
jgi:hypothetical protein